MEDLPSVQPLSLQRRRYLTFFLLGLFVVGLPFLYFYATGYRLSLDEERASFISTGGLYVTAERAGAEIYIDGELVRETRTFRTAFYAQGLEPKTHRVHVQRDGYHTWVKELPVYAHIVTEAQAFNIPLVPRLRTISPWQNSGGDTVIFASSTLTASTTNSVVVGNRWDTTLLNADNEFETLKLLFEDELVLNTLTSKPATTTKELNGVRLSQVGDDIVAIWVSPQENMPYYYCAEAFEPFDVENDKNNAYEFIPVAHAAEVTTEMIGPVQSVSESSTCDPRIVIDRKGEHVKSFDFFDGNPDLVLLSLDSGVYVVEIDDRAWQNIQPLVEGEELEARTASRQTYIYDGTLIYHIEIE